MQTDFLCPVCEGDRWRSAQTFAYSRREHADGQLSEYITRRRRVLFEVWFPGAESVELASQYCLDCGFMTYRPRPTVADLDAKWQFLAQIRRPRSADDQQTEADSAGVVNEPRARRVFHALRPHLNGRRLQVLDFGGGNGQLMLPFLHRGDRCCLVDYTPRQLPGIEKLGDTLDQVATDLRFDVIICSHVLEHLADPAGVLRDLSGRLTDAGRIYGEVPLEIWKRLPIRNDPVTHVNFFTPGSFAELFRRQGLGVQRAHRLRGSYYADSKDVIVVVAGREAAGEQCCRSGGAQETERLLNPTPWMSFQRRWRNRDLPILRRIARRAG